MCHRHKLFFLVVFSVFVNLAELYPSRNLLPNYLFTRDNCTLHSSCGVCKKNNQCDWCHEYGCTSFPYLTCPKKNFHKDSKSNYERYCTTIVSHEPIFVPANVRHFISVDLKIDDIVLYNKEIICEIKINFYTIHVPASLVGSAAYCEMMIIKTRRPVSLGHLQLYWGGAEPVSNYVALVVYSCEHLSSNCNECLFLSKEYKCGWCKETGRCTLVSQCPRQYGLWLNGSRSCN